jgi:hypothetical protein
MTKVKMTGSMAQVVEHRPKNHKSLISNPRIAKKQNKTKKTPKDPQLIPSIL